VRGSTLYLQIRNGCSLDPTGSTKYYLCVTVLNNIFVSGHGYFRNFVYPVTSEDISGGGDVVSLGSK
jgi:hypothetical protein